MYAGIWWESQKQRDHYEDLNVDGKILKWCGVDSSGSGQTPVAKAALNLPVP
jgi:hypothetical protein